MMTEFWSQQFGKWLIITGLIIMLTGGMIILLGKCGFFRLPGDVELGGKNWRIFIPITSGVLISIILTILLWLVNYFRH